MATVSKDAYDRLIENRPFKFSADEVAYRPGDKEHQCKGCAHLFSRVVNEYNVCEIFRPSDDESVIANYVCDFWTDDTEEHPLLPEE